MKETISILCLTFYAFVINAQTDLNENDLSIAAQGLANTPIADYYKSQFAGARMSYFPDENKTYIAEKIPTYKEEGDFAFKFINVKAIINNRLPIMLAPIITPGLNFTVERDKKRKAVTNAGGSVDHYVCAYNGRICVILWND